MLTEQTVEIENIPLSQSLQMDSLLKQCFFLHVTDAQINLQKVPFALQNISFAQIF